MTLNENEIAKLLEEDIVYIATTKKNTNPHLVPIWFVSHNGKIYFETGLNTLTYKNIEHNNNIMLCFGGKETYLIKGTTRKYPLSESPISMDLYREKYSDFVKDDYFGEDTYVYEVIIEQELSWHYS